MKKIILNNGVEMPLLGYGGYVPFALELFAIYHLVMGALGRRSDAYLQIGDRALAITQSAEPATVDSGGLGLRQP